MPGPPAVDTVGRDVPARRHLGTGATGRHPEDGLGSTEPPGITSLLLWRFQCGALSRGERAVWPPGSSCVRSQRSRGERSIKELLAIYLDMRAVADDRYRGTLRVQRANHRQRIGARDVQVDHHHGRI